MVLFVRLPRRVGVISVGLWLCSSLWAGAQVSVTIDASNSARQQNIDGFGTCLSGNEAGSSWWQQLYYDDLGASMLRMDLTPNFRSPYSDNMYNCPTWGNPGPDGYYARAYTNAQDYRRVWSGRSAPIAVMGPNIETNIGYFVFPSTPGSAARAGTIRRQQLGDFKLIGSLWSPAPWVKLSSGNTYGASSYGMPATGTPWPFIWLGNFAGGKLDVSGTALADFDDSALGGSGPTSALTQFARCTAAYVRGFQRLYQVQFYAISIQNELNFEEFYNSCTYPLSSQYIAGLKAIRAEFDKYPDLANIKLMGPEDLLGGDIWGMWQYGGGSSTIHKNLQYLQNIALDSQAAAAEAFFCIHGYASDGVSAANATPTLWNWWVNGWTSSPTLGIPPNIKGFSYYGKKSWMTETSGENPAWLYPTTGYPSEGAWGVALRIQQALTAGQESAWLYWQCTDGNAVGNYTLTSASATNTSPKYVAAKHFFRYIRPDSVRVGATVSGSTNLLVSAFVHDTNRTITAVILNCDAAPVSASLSLPSQFPGINSLRVFTSRDGAYWQPSTVSVTNGTSAISLPGYSVVTVYGVVPPILSAQLTSSDQLTLSWSQANVGFVLQNAPAVNTLANWTVVTNACVVSNGLATVNVPVGTGPIFYRLNLP